MPLGILTLAVALEILTRFKPFAFLKVALAPTWIAGALSALATVALGYMHASEDSFQDMPAVEAHRLAGVTLCAVTCLIALLRTRMLPAPTWPKWAGPAGMFAPAYRAIQPAFAPGSKLDKGYDRIWVAPVAVILALMFLTGHLGGNLTHGDTYLIQYAPGPVRMLAGLPANAGPRPKPKDLASADLYLDVVQPALEQRCSGCHNNSKKSGGFSVATYDTLMKGGSKGPVIVAGNPGGSDLFHRVNLTPDSGDFMPKDGKTPLNKNEIAAVGAWIKAGAPATATVGSLKLAAADANAIQAVIGATGGGANDETVAFTPAPGEGCPARGGGGRQGRRGQGHQRQLHRAQGGQELQPAGRGLRRAQAGDAGDGGRPDQVRAQHHAPEHAPRRGDGRGGQDHRHLQEPSGPSSGEERRHRRGGQGHRHPEGPDLPQPDQHQGDGRRLRGPVEPAEPAPHVRVGHAGHHHRRGQGEGLAQGHDPLRRPHAQGRAGGDQGHATDQLTKAGNRFRKGGSKGPPFSWSARGQWRSRRGKPDAGPYLIWCGCRI
ncbi:MAG: c-type cytochrome domain-containing protein [Caulobacteraceae bacterium]